LNANADGLGFSSDTRCSNRDVVAAGGVIISGLIAEGGVVAACGLFISCTSTD